MLARNKRERKGEERKGRERGGERGGPLNNFLLEHRYTKGKRTIFTRVLPNARKEASNTPLELNHAS